jgi:membrane-associated protein
MRTIAALPLALTDMPWRVFSALNFASAFTWTFARAGAGYLFGLALDHYVGDN